MLKFEQIIDGVWLLKVPFEGMWTGVFLFDSEEKMVLDCGPSAAAIDEYVMPALKDLGVEPSDIKWVLNTHCHGDHAHGNPRFMELTGAKLAAYDNACMKFLDPLFYSRKTRTHFPEFSPKAPAQIPRQVPDLVLHDGDEFLGRFVIYSTPGHDTECISVLDKKTNSLFTGDSIQLRGTIGPAGQGVGFYKYIDDYSYTLDRVEKIDPDNLFCSHDYLPEGFAFVGKENARRCIKICQEAYAAYEKRTKELLDAGITDVKEVAKELIAIYDHPLPEQLMMPMYTAEEHMKKLGYKPE